MNPLSVKANSHMGPASSKQHASEWAGADLSGGTAPRGLAGSSPAPAASHAEPVHILIVDDEPNNLTVLESILDEPGYQLVRAETAEQALLALLIDDFALLILDIRMPSMNGFELAKIIKERRKNARVPIIFLTAYYNDDQNVIEGYGSGAVDYLLKPVNANVLRSKVAVFVELYRKQRDLEASNRTLLAEIASRRNAEDQLRELNTTLEQRVSERTRHISLLMKEVDHRSKNILALVQSIARQTAMTSPDGFVERFSERIQALAASHDLLVKNQWQGIALRDVMATQLAHLGDLLGTRIMFLGEPIVLSSTAAQVLGMATHELATNACKYGALSNDSGRIDVRWTMVRDNLVIDWTEAGGPPVAVPERRGMGSKVIETVTAKSLGGSAQIEFAPTGVSWRLECPLANAKEASLPASRVGSTIHA